MTSNPSRADCRPATLAAELRVAVMRTSRRMRNERSVDDVTPGQYTVLATLDHHGSLTPRELAEHERVRPPSMTRTLNLLVDLDLVQRTEHPSDRRQVLVSLTSQGQAVVTETRRRRDAWLARRLAELDAQEREVLARAAVILRRVADG